MRQKHVGRAEAGLLSTPRSLERPRWWQYWKRIACSLSLLAVVAALVCLRQFAVQRAVSVSASGAALEVAQRDPVNRTSFVTHDESGSLQIATTANVVANRSVVKPWELREKKDLKKLTKKNVSSEDASSKKISSTSPRPKPKKVFEKSSPGYTPGSRVLPTEGRAITSLKSFDKFVRSKCAGVVAFYNSADETKTRQLAAVWKELYERFSVKFAFGLCDVQKNADSVAVAVEAGIFPSETAERQAVGFPAVIAYATKNYTNESVVLFASDEPFTFAALSRSLDAVVANLRLGLSKKDGCYASSKTPFADAALLETAAAADTSRGTSASSSSSPKKSTKKKADEDDKKEDPDKKKTKKLKPAIPPPDDAAAAPKRLLSPSHS